MEFIKFLMRESPTEARFILLMSVIQGVAAGVFPGLVIYAAADIVKGQDYMIWGGLLILNIVAQIVTYRLAESRTATLTELALEEMLLGIADALRREELHQFERRNHTEIRLSMGEARSVAEAAVQSVRSFQCLITVFILWLYIFSLSGAAGLIFLLIFGLTILCQDVLQRTVRDILFEFGETERNLFSVFRHFTEGFREIRIDYLKNQDLFENYLKPLILKTQELRYRASYIHSDFGIYLIICLSFLTGSEVFFLPSLSPPHVIVQLLVCTLYAFKPSLTLLSALPHISRGQASMERLIRFSGGERLSRKSESYVSDPEGETPGAFHTLTMADVVFTYYESDGSPGFSAGPFSLTLSPGEIVFLAGGNGSGKSTFVKILTGLYPSVSGKLMIDGQDADLSHYRNLFSAVFSDFHLFDALYGIDRPDMQKIQGLLVQMRLDRKTRFADGRFSTTDLSAGQRRRLAMVAALQEDRPIYVFDEWAADQDPYFRRWFYEELLPSLKKQGKIVIAVTHDDGFYHLADRLIIMKDGKIVDDRHPEKAAEPAISFPADPSPRSRAGNGNLTAPESVRHEFSGHDPDAESQEHPPDTPGFNLRQIRPVLIKLGWLGLADGLNWILKIHILFEVAVQPEEIGFRWVFLFILSMLADFIVARRFNLTVVETLESLSADFRIRVTDRVRKIGLSFFETMGAGPVFTALTVDIASLSNASFMLALMLKFTMTVLSMTIYLACLSFPAFIATTVIAGGISLFYIRNQYRIIDVTEQLRRGEAAFYDAVSHLIGGFKELRLNDRKNDAFFHKSLANRCSDLRSMRLKSVQYMMTNTVIVFGVWTVLLGIFPLLFPFIGISAKVLFKCIAILCFIPINVFILMLPAVLNALTSFQRLQKTETALAAAEQDIVTQVPRTERETFRELRFQNIMFCYRSGKGDHEFSVGPLNLSLHAGQTVFITGGNGSGKSTLVKLITGLYSPTAGQVLLNGQLTDMRRHRYLFSVIFSDFHLFDRLYGIPDPDEDRVNGLIRRMGLEKRVKFAEGKFTTTDLSSGQKKRLALAAVLMEDRPIFLFDEWAAEQDPYFRQYFYETLVPEFAEQGKTVIAVTHHDQYFHLADRVLKMEDGQIKAS